MTTNTVIVSRKIASIVSEGNIRIDTTDVRPLAGSIKAQGLLQPIGVSPRKDGTWKLEFGHNRLEACKLLGWEEIPTIEVKPTDKAEDRAMRQLVENVQRTNITFHEQGLAFTLAKEAGKSVADMAKATGLSDKHIHAAIKVASVNPIAASKVRSMPDPAPMSEWVALATFRGAEAQQAAADRLVAGHSLRAERARAKAGKAGKAPSGPTTLDVLIDGLTATKHQNLAACFLWLREGGELPMPLDEAITAAGYVWDIDAGKLYSQADIDAAAAEAAALAQQQEAEQS